MEIWTNGSLRPVVEWISSNSPISVRAGTAKIQYGHDTNSSTLALDGDYSEMAIWTEYVPDWFAKAYTIGFSPDWHMRNRVLYHRALDASDVFEIHGNFPSYVGAANARHPRIIQPSNGVFVVLATVQMAFPSADISLGGWTPSAGGSPTELWPMIDEETADDADFIQSVLTPSNDTCEVRLQALGDPAVSTGHVVRYRYSKSFAAGRVDLTVKLMDGATEIASFTHSDISTTDTQADQTLSAAQADSISDYGDLRLRFTADQP